MEWQPVTPETYCPIVELRQYTLHPGTRETLIALFDREFVEPQEVAGMQVIGQFRDLDRPDHFVWFRGFTEIATRAQALTRFYSGPVWRAHRDAANATMIDSDDVFLLREARPGSGLRTHGRIRSAPGAPASNAHLLSVTVSRFSEPVCERAAGFLYDVIEPALIAEGALIRGTYITEYGPNDYPALPVRQGEHAVVWVAEYADVRSLAADSVASDPGLLWRRTALGASLAAAPTVLRLASTARSLL